LKGLRVFLILSLSIPSVYIPREMEFPTLYGEASTGKTKVWSIKVRDAGGLGEIVVEHGYADGKKQVNTKVIDSGKNIGKKNETTAVQQAVSEARATWQKKKDAGYVEAAAGAGSGGRKGGGGSGSGKVTGVAASRAKATTDEVPLPMLALDFNKRGGSIKFPCYVQRKYDGTRCVAVPGAGLFSRNRKKYPHMGHILEEIKSLPASLVLDGELFSKELTFQDIVGLVKRETLKPGDAEKQLKIELHVYDIISDAPYEDRKGRLEALFARFKFKYLKMVTTEVCEKKEDLKALHDKYVGEGFEGIMLRNKAGLYKVGQRSSDLQKYKEFEDSEYEITGYSSGTGVEEGCVIWECKTKAGQKFMCRPRGTREERVELLAKGDSYIGKMLTVKFQELTTDGIPRFPVGIGCADGVAVRDYE
jgi:ATP-dependent DNA ligase